jgi:hypothetical protein
MRASNQQRKRRQMRLAVIRQLLPILSLAGCVSARPPQPAAPPSVPVPSPINTGPKTWSFSFTPGIVAYKISRSATIEDLDAGAKREISTNSSHESIGLQATGDTISFTAAVDTFSTTTQGAIGPAQAAQLPLQLSGLLIGDSIVITDSLAQKCNPVATALITDLHNLLATFPDTLSIQMSWRDSTSLLGCQGSIGTQSHITRSYKVIGESIYEGISVVMVQRTDTIQATGEGAQQQHRILLDARGIGSAVYYLDINSGRVLHLSSSQDLNLVVTASGKSSHFRESAKQEFALVR